MEEEVKTEVEEVTPEVEEAVSEDDDYTADIEDEIDDDDAEEIDDLEYDDEGNVIFSEEDDDAEADTTAEKEVAEAPPEAPATDETLARVTKDLELLRSLSKDTLKKLGYDGDDPVEGLIQAAAEADGVSVEEYKKTLEANRIRAEETRKAREEGMRVKMERDLAAVKAEIPSASAYKSVEDFPNFKRFGELVDLGLTPAEAYRASHPREIAEAVAASVNQAAKDSKDHLKSSVPKGAKDKSVVIPRAQLAEFRDMFPGTSDKELVKLYKKVKQN